jgi:hypothetical protein
MHLQTPPASKPVTGLSASSRICWWFEGADTKRRGCRLEGWREHMLFHAIGNYYISQEQSRRAANTHHMQGAYRAYKYARNQGTEKHVFLLEVIVAFFKILIS